VLGEEQLGLFALHTPSRNHNRPIGERCPLPSAGLAER